MASTEVSWRSWAIVQALRTITTIESYLSSPQVPLPDQILSIPSRDPKRSIKAHLYISAHPSPDSSPVLINANGSAFVLPLHGTDATFCAHVAKHTHFSVLDIDYRLAPEHPFPAALHDVQDVLTHTLANPAYDAKHIAISGFSSGANLVLGAAATAFPDRAFAHAFVVYPATELATPRGDRRAPEPGGRVPPPWIAGAFDESYLRPGVDRRQAGVSPFYGERFPGRLTFVTAGRDPMSGHTETLARRLEGEGRDVVLRRFEGVEHGFDKGVLREGSKEGEAAREMLELAVERLGRA